MDFDCSIEIDIELEEIELDDLMNKIQSSPTYFHDNYSKWYHINDNQWNITDDYLEPGFHYMCNITIEHGMYNIRFDSSYYNKEYIYWIMSLFDNNFKENN